MFNRVIALTTTATCASALYYHKSNTMKSSFAENPESKAAARNAICLLYPNNENKTFGIVSF